MEYSPLLPGAPGHNRRGLVTIVSLLRGYLGAASLVLVIPVGNGRTEDRSRRGSTTGSPHKIRSADIPRHAGRYLGVDPRPRRASVLIARLERMGGVRFPEIAVPQVEQRCGKLLRRMETEWTAPPRWGWRASGRLLRHAGRASPLGGSDSLSGDRARLEDNRKSDAAYLILDLCANSRTMRDCRAARSNPAPGTDPTRLPGNGLEPPSPTPAWPAPASVSR